MKLIVKGRYHNNPAELHFDAPGVFEVDNKKAEFLLCDAPENFAVYAPPADATVTQPAIPQNEQKDLSAPPTDKMLRAPKNKK